MKTKVIKSTDIAIIELLEDIVIKFRKAAIEGSNKAFLLEVAKKLTQEINERIEALWLSANN